MFRCLLRLTYFLLFIAHAVSGQTDTTKLWQPYYIMPRSGGQHLDLSAGWQLGYKEKPVARPEEVQSVTGWITVAQPTSVHMALFKAGKLPNPYVGLNTKKYEWIAGKAWYYKKTFTLQKPEQKSLVFLSFDGVDYFARVWLNGRLLGAHEGMFGGPEIEISNDLTYGPANEIVVEVLAGNYFADKKRSTGVVTNSFADNSARVIRPWALAGGFAHEMFYVMGMWQGARLDIVPQTHLERPFLTTVSLSPGQAVVRLKTELFIGKHSLQYQLHPWDHQMLNTYPSATYLQDQKLVLEVRLSSGGKVFTESFPLQVFDGRNFIDKEFTISNPRIWNPNGMGESHLYKAELVLKEEGRETDKITFDFGIRKVDWVRSAGPVISERWTDWQCVVNGQKVFLKGTNWMPAEMLLDLPAEKYQWALEMAKNAGIQIIRVWGAGLQEPDIFYGLCNRMGLMVWQDFTMNSAASNLWPQDVWEAQVLHTVFRIRTNPSLVVYGGGNETNPYSRANAQAIGILERNLKLFDDTRFFVRTSPDLGSMHPYPTFDAAWYRHKYRFVPFFAETGFFSMANAQTIKETIPAAELGDFTSMADPAYADKHPSVIHQFNSFATLNVDKILNRSSHITPVKGISVEELAEASQIGAAEFFQLLIEAARSNYPVTTGVMTWVLKRPYPVVAAHQIIDGMDRPLAAYYAVKKAYEPLHVGLDIERMLWKPGETMPVKVSVLNSLMEEMPGCQLSVKVLNDVFQPLYSADARVTVPGGESVTPVRCAPFVIPEEYRDKFFFVITELKDSAGRLMTRSVYWPRTIARMSDPAFYKAYTEFNTNEWPLLPDGPWLKSTVQKGRQARLKLEVTGKEKVTDRVSRLQVKVTNQGQVPSFMTTLALESNDFIFYNSDNYFWLEPGESRELTMHVAERSVVYHTGKARPAQVITLRSWNGNTAEQQIDLKKIAKR
jgi:beta-mannosidase